MAPSKQPTLPEKQKKAASGTKKAASSTALPINHAQFITLEDGTQVCTVEAGAQMQLGLPVPLTAERACLTSSGVENALQLSGVRQLPRLFGVQLHNVAQSEVPPSRAQQRPGTQRSCTNFSSQTKLHAHDHGNCTATKHEHNVLHQGHLVSGCVTVHVAGSSQAAPWYASRAGPGYPDLPQDQPRGR